MIKQKTTFLLLFTLFLNLNISSMSWIKEKITNLFITPPNELLLAGVVENDLEKIIFAFELGAQIDSQDPNLSILTQKSAWHGNLKAIKILIENGADIKTKDPYGHTPLHIAASKNFPSIAKFLIFQTNEDIDYINEINNIKNSALHLAALTNSNETAKILIKYGAEINKKGENGNTPLHIAIRKNHLKIIKTLVLEGASITIQNDQKITPLNFGTESTNKYTNKIKRIERKRRNERIEKLKDEKPVPQVEPISPPSPQPVKTFQVKELKSRDTETKIIMNERLRKYNTKRPQKESRKAKRVKEEKRRMLELEKAQARLKKERLEQERLEQERLEQERLEQERLEQERLELERLELETKKKFEKAIKLLQALIKTMKTQESYNDKKQSKQIAILQALLKRYIQRKSYLEKFELQKTLEPTSIYSNVFSDRKSPVFSYSDNSLRESPILDDRRRCSPFSYNSFEGNSLSGDNSFRGSPLFSGDESESSYEQSDFPLEDGSKKTAQIISKLIKRSDSCPDFSEPRLLLKYFEELI